MSRKDGFIILDQILGIGPIDSFGSLIKKLKQLAKKKRIEIIKINEDSSVGTQIVFSFVYNGETYYYKYDSMANPYNELIASEIAKDMKINCVEYDIAICGFLKGTLSKDFKKSKGTYVLGNDFLYLFNFPSNYKRWNSYQNILWNLKRLLFIIYQNILDYFKYLSYNDFFNNLEYIWSAVEEYYKSINHTDSEKLIEEFMNSLINIFIFDIITKQVDRTSLNWCMIVNEDGSLKLQAIFDNIRILWCTNNDFLLGLTTNSDSAKASYNIKKFQAISSSEFTSLLPENLWVISEDNLNKIFGRIEYIVGYPMPNEVKKDYLEKFGRHLDFLKDCLGISEKR